MYLVYVIESIKDGTFYIGKTSNFEDRLIWHNSFERSQSVTKRKRPWQHFYTLEVENQIVAGKLEKHIKGMKSRKYILNLAKYPEIGQRLIEKYS